MLSLVKLLTTQFKWGLSSRSTSAISCFDSVFTLNNEVFSNFSHYKRNIIIIAMVLIYLALGIVTEIKFAEMKPLSLTLLEDFGYYDRALRDALAGADPYRVRTVGAAFLYPPPALLLVEPFHMIPAGGLRALSFTAANSLLLAALVAGVCREYNIPLRQAWYLFPVAMGFAPFLELLHVGQINLITLAGIGLLFLKEEKSPAMAGFGLAVAIWTKVSPLLLLLYLIGRNQYRVITWTVGFSLLILLAAVARYGIGPFQTYPDVFVQLLRVFPGGTNSMSFVTKVLPPGTAQAAFERAHFILQLYSVSMVAASVFMERIRKAGREHSFIVTCIVMALCPNVMWYHHFVFLILPMLVLACSSKLRPITLALCYFLMLVVQVDRFALGRGLLVHVGFQLLAVGILIWDIFIGRGCKFLVSYNPKLTPRP